jgi:cell wall assembly regulator SMI1
MCQNALVTQDNLAHEVREMLPHLRCGREERPARGATDREIADLVARLGRPLPAELEAWLRICNGDTIGPGGVYGARPDRPFLDIASRLADFPGWREHSWLPVAGDGFGNPYVLMEQPPLSGFVGFVEPMVDPDAVQYVVGSDLMRFLRALFARDLRELAGEEVGDDWWPFARDAVLAADPRLAEAPRPMLPWET